MNWIKFVENHNSEIRLPKIGRSIYSHASKTSTNTLITFFRETEKIIDA